MNERLPYEEQFAKQLEDLHLPDENAAWKEMRQRLDKDDDNPIIPPPVKGCLGYGVLLLLIATILYFVFRGDKQTNRSNNKTTDSVETIANNKNTSGASPGRNTSKDFHKKNSTTTYKNDTIPAIEKDQHDSSFVAVENKNKGNNSFTGDKIIINKKTKSKSNIQRPGSDNNKKDITGSKKRRTKIREYEKSRPGILGSDQTADQHSDSIENFSLKKDSTLNNTTSTSQTILDNDSTIVKKQEKNYSDSTGKNGKSNPSDKRQTYFAAGVGIHQQLPVDGQKLVPYNSLGRKSTLADYIPSIYFRMYKDRRWFIESEFRYGAPQSTKEIIYKQQKQVDASGSNTSITSTKVKKTYYHQLPLSFNYFILPVLSVGAGITWNRFSSAVLDREFRVTNIITQQDSLKVSSVLYSRKPDSNFVTSYFQALFETQYEWKRFSIGARYSFGLEPYIKFQLPGGQKQEEKNSSLQIFIRYNLWESKKK